MPKSIVQILDPDSVVVDGEEISTKAGNNCCKCLFVPQSRQKKEALIAKKKIIKIGNLVIKLTWRKNNDSTRKIN